MNKLPTKPSKSTLSGLTLLGIFNLGVSLVIAFTLIFGALYGYQISRPVSVAVDTPAPEVVETSTPTRTDTPVPIQQATATSTPEELEALITPGEPMVVKYETGQNYIRLPDGSEIILGLNSEIELNKVFGLTRGASEHEVLLLRGTILVISRLPEGRWFTVINPDGYIARVTGSVMVVGYDAETGQFITDCVEGDCELGPDAQTLFQLAADDQGWLDENGNFQGPFEVDMEELRTTYGEAIPTEPPDTETPEPDTETPEPDTETPDAEAAATAACEEHLSQFPLTPCGP